MMSPLIIILVGLKNHFTLLKNNGVLLILVLLLTFFTLLYLLYKPRKMQVKIENFFFAWLAAFIYIFFYIIFFFYLRYNVIGTTINIKEKYINLTKIFIDINNFSLYKQILAYILILILIVLWFLIFIKIRNKLGYKIWQLYFYRNFFERAEENLEKYSESFFIKIINNLHHYSYKNIKLELQVFIDKIIKKITKNNNHWLIKNKKLFYIRELIIILFPTILLLMIFILEITLNNMNLFYIFYYIPLYAIIMLWRKVTDIIKFYTYSGEGHVLYEMAYKYPDIIYLNLSTMERLRLKSFLYKYENVHRSTLFFMEEYVLVGIMPEDPIIARKRYERFQLKDGRIIYYNLFMDLFCEEKDIRKDGEYYVIDEEKK